MKIDSFDFTDRRASTGLQRNVKITLDGVEVSGDIQAAKAGEDGFIRKLLRNEQGSFYLNETRTLAATEVIQGKVSIEVIDVPSYLVKQNALSEA